jgi:hypothetical protein
MLHPSTSAFVIVENIHDPDTVTLLELCDGAMPVQYAPAGHSLHEACAAVSWYCPGGHIMQADVAAPPLL